MKQQRGGTFLGFIIGLVVGLGGALAVAVYVTKVPIPFVNKVQTRSAEQDAAEALKNKQWDPNAPLYGKNPAKPTAAASADGQTDVPASTDAEVSAPTPAVKSSVKAETKAEPKTDAKADAKADAKGPPKAEVKPAVTADPLGDLAKARAAAPNPSVTASVDLFTYFVQVGAFRTAEDAESQRAKLSLSGVEAKVSEREQAGRAVFRVRVGPFDHKEEADKLKEKLTATGVDTALVRVQR